MNIEEFRAAAEKIERIARTSVGVVRNAHDGMRLDYKHWRLGPEGVFAVCVPRNVGTDNFGPGMREALVIPNDELARLIADC